MTAANRNDFASQTCQACEKGTPPKTRQQAEAALSNLPDWRLSPEGTAISRPFAFDNFYQTMSFVNAVAHVANTQNHHPDLVVGYNKCEVTFSTHSIGGLSDNDFICAAKVDRVLAP